MSLIHSNFIDDFLDLTSNLPREIIRILKLIREVDEKSVKINKSLFEYRKTYLLKLKSLYQNEMNQNASHKLQINDEESNKLYNDIENKHKLALSFSQIKKELINELHYLLLGDNLSALVSIIEKGEKECQLQNQLNYPNLLSHSNTNPYSIEILGDSFSYGNSLNKKKGEKSVNQNEFLLKKKKRQNNKSKSKNSTLNGSIMNEGSIRNENVDSSLQDTGENIDKPYCLCGGPSYGDMIECDNPYCLHQWFHYGCVGLKEAPTKNKWYCSETCKNEANKEEKLNKKKKKK